MSNYAGAAHGGSIDQALMFAGHNVDRFAPAPFSSNGIIQTGD